VEAEGLYLLYSRKKKTLKRGLKEKNHRLHKYENASVHPFI
jgi:hypothetical protein